MSEAMPTRISVLDVIEHALGERGDRVPWHLLAAKEIFELRDRLLEFSEADAFSPAPDGTYLLGGEFLRYWEDPFMRGQIGDALLYYPQLLVIDPYADFFADTSVLPEMRPLRYTRNGRQIMSVSGGGAIWASNDLAERFMDQPAKIAARLGEITHNLYDLEAPIRSGAIVLRNQWEVLRKTRTALEASVRHDVRSPAMQSAMLALQARDAKLPLWDNLRGFHVTGSGDLRPADKAWEFQHYFFHLAKSLAIAESAYAIYAPSWEEDMKLLEAKVGSTSTAAYPSQVLAEVARAVLPSADVAIREAVRIRADSDAFGEWRVKLRGLARDARADSPEQLRERVEDTFQPVIGRINRELSASRSAAAKHAATDFVVLGTISGTAAAISPGSTIAGTGIAVGAAAVTGAVDWIRRAYRRPKLVGAEAVLASLIRRS